MKQYSADLRERLLRAIDAGLSVGEAARLFGVGQTTIDRWRRRRRATASPAAKPRPGRPPRLGANLLPALEAQVRAAPDATLAEHCAAWEREQGVRLSTATMSRAIRRLGWTVKKSPSPPPSATRQRAPPGGPRRRDSTPRGSSSSTKAGPTRR